jgi:S1-C subfamily serine protease
MSPVDITIILVLALCAFLSYKRGATQQLCVGIGLLLGLSIGSRLGLLLISHTTNSVIRMAGSVAICSLVSLGLLRLGMKLGAQGRARILATKAYKPDQYTGIIVGAVGGIIVCWFSASLILSAHSANAQNAILGSKIIGFIDRQSLFGKSAYDIFYLINPDHAFNVGQVVAGPDEASAYNSISTNLPSQGPFARAVAKDYPSVVRIIRQGCYLSDSYGSGSGYIAAPDIVVTAAHVVAGSSLVAVQDTQNNSYTGDVIDYDVKHDLAVIYVSGLPDPPLPLDASVQKVGEPVAILGFPGGNPFEANSGIIQVYASYSALTLTTPALNAGKGAMFYQSSAAAFPGDSGGPLITQSGSVIGHFTIYDPTDPSYVTSDDNPADIAYTFSVALHDYYQELLNSEKSIQRVSTGYCPDD